VIIREDAINQELLTTDIEKILPMILSSFDDTWAECVRVAGAEALTQFVIKSSICHTEFLKIYTAIKERLDHPSIPVRVAAAASLLDIFPSAHQLRKYRPNGTRLFFL
jgi:hypothetical protein